MGDFHLLFFASLPGALGSGSGAVVEPTSAARPLYPRKLTTCCNAQVVSIDRDHAIADFDQALKLNISSAKARHGLERLQGQLTKGK
jgi:hypothetical protein